MCVIIHSIRWQNRNYIFSHCELLKKYSDFFQFVSISFVRCRLPHSLMISWVSVELMVSWQKFICWISVQILLINKWQEPQNWYINIKLTYNLVFIILSPLQTYSFSPVLFNSVLYEGWPFLFLIFQDQISHHNSSWILHTTILKLIYISYDYFQYICSLIWRICF